MQSKNKLTIIIVTFNSEKIIQKCLKNLDQKLYDVIIIDNNSKDNTVNIIKEKFLDAKIIPQSVNHGFNRGNNIGIKQAKTEFILLLNPDSIIKNQEIEKAINFLQENQDIAMAGVNLVDPNDEDHYKNYIKNKHLILDIDNNSSLVNFVSGACMFIRKDFLEKFGILDENIFLFHDDNEICLRAVKNNQKIAFLKNITAYHEGGNSSDNSMKKQISKIKTWHLAWSKLYFKEKKDGKFKAKKLGIALIIRYIIEIIFLKNIKQNLLKINATFYYLINKKPFKKDGNPR